MSIITESVGNFILHPGLIKEHYELTPSFRTISRWRAYSHQPAYYTDESKNTETGHMGVVGYVMISLNDNTIVPISRADEHHRGMDVMYDEISKECKKNGHPINPRDYIPVWTGGNNYVYEKNDIRPLTIALKKFLSYGGMDGPVVGAFDMDGLLMPASKFVAANGDFTLAPDKLASGGQRIFDAFVKMASDLDTAMTSFSPSTINASLKSVIKGLAQIRPFIPYLGINGDIQELLYKDTIANLAKEGNVVEIQKLIFGFHGLKNAIHNAIREVNQGKENWETDRIKALWGDTNLAEHMLGNI